MQNHVQAVNAVLKKNEGPEPDSSEPDEEDVREGSKEEPEPLDLQEEFVDDDKFTTVTVEAVDVSRDGLMRVKEFPEEPKQGNGISGGISQDTSREYVSRTDMNGIPMLGEERSKHPKMKSKKQRFKYESKTDRKVTRFKERRKGKRQAKERKGK